MSQRDQLAADLRAMADNIAAGAVSLAGAVRQTGAKALPATVTGGALVGHRRKRKRRTMSAEAREKIAAAQRARWAKQKGQAPFTATAKAAKKGRRRRKAKREGTSTNG
jgi:hypothetical protein